MSELAMNQINLVARDFDATITFYRRLGLDVTERSAPDLDVWHAEVTFSDGLVLEFDNRTLAARYNSAWRSSDGGNRALFNYSLPTRESVDATYAELSAAGYRSAQVPYDAFWGARYAIVSDPDGNDVGLMSPIDEGRRMWPPVDSPIA